MSTHKGTPDGCATHNYSGKTPLVVAHRNQDLLGKYNFTFLSTGNLLCSKGGYILFIMLRLIILTRRRSVTYPRSVSKLNSRIQ
jgi:hypothetical protein